MNYLLLSIRLTSILLFACNFAKSEQARAKNTEVFTPQVGNLKQQNQAMLPIDIRPALEPAHKE